MAKSDNAEQELSLWKKTREEGAVRFQKKKKSRKSLPFEDIKITAIVPEGL